MYLLHKQSELQNYLMLASKASGCSAQQMAVISVCPPAKLPRAASGRRTESGRRGCLALGTISRSGCLQIVLSATTRHALQSSAYFMKYSFNNPPITLDPFAINASKLCVHWNDDNRDC